MPTPETTATIVATSEVVAKPGQVLQCTAKVEHTASAAGGAPSLATAEAKASVEMPAAAHAPGDSLLDNLAMDGVQEELEREVFQQALDNEKDAIARADEAEARANYLQGLLNGILAQAHGNDQATADQIHNMLRRPGTADLSALASVPPLAKVQVEPTTSKAAAPSAATTGQQEAPSAEAPVPDPASKDTAQATTGKQAAPCAEAQVPDPASKDTAQATTTGKQAAPCVEGLVPDPASKDTAQATTGQQAAPRVEGLVPDRASKDTTQATTGNAAAAPRAEGPVPDPASKGQTQATTGDTTAAPSTEGRANSDTDSPEAEVHRIAKEAKKSYMRYYRSIRNLNSIIMGYN